MEKELHREMQRFVTPKTTFEELYYYMNKFIEDNGYFNLDFLGNLGHSIVKQKNDRIYIEKGNTTRLLGFFLFILRILLLFWPICFPFLLASRIFSFVL